MEEKNTKAIFEDADSYRDYFKDDEEALDDVVERLKKLQSISDGQIDKIAEITQQSAVSAASRGSQHYLIEHITNAIQIQSQMQSVLKDKHAIKETALNLAIKNSKEADANASDNDAIMASLMQVIADMKKEAKTHSAKAADLEKTTENINIVTDDTLDKEIEKKLGKN